MRKPLLIPMLSLLVVSSTTFSSFAAHADAPRGAQCESVFAGTEAKTRFRISLNASGRQQVATPENTTETTEVDATTQLKVEAAIRQDALAMLDEIMDQDRTLQSRRVDNGEIERGTSYKLRANLERLLRTLATEGEVGAAIDAYRTVFRDVEVTYDIVTGNNKRIAQIKEAIENKTLAPKAGTTEIKRLRDDSAPRLKKFGIAYGDYVVVREYLEKVIELNTWLDTDDFINGQITPIKFVSNSLPAGVGATGQGAVANVSQTPNEIANYVLRRLGARGLSGYAPELEISSLRVAIADIKAMFRSEPEALIAKLELDNRVELVTKGLRMIVPYQTLQTVRSALNVLPPSLVRPAAILMGVSYDVYVRRRFLSDISLIARIPDQYDADGKTTSARLDVIRELVAKRSDSVEMLTTFARMIHRNQVWKELMAQAALFAPTDWRYQQLYDKFVKAEKRAEGLGDLSVLHVPSRSDRIGQTIYAVAIGAGVIYLNPDLASSALEGLKGVLMGVGGACDVGGVAAQVCSQLKDHLPISGL